MTRLPRWAWLLGHSVRVELEQIIAETVLRSEHDDLVAASRQGFRTAFVVRPAEYGPGQAKNLKAEHDFDYAAESFIDLADQLGCP